MRKYLSSDLTRFFQAVDRRLSEPFQLIVIGGSAALLGYGIDRVTRDVDTPDGSFRKIADLLEAARQETGLPIPVDLAAVYDAPHDYEARLLVAPVPGLEKLRIFVPEKHDLVLMKTMRAEEVDLETAEQIHAQHGLDSEILLDRWIREMGHVIGDHRRLDLNFLALVGRLYGEQAALDARDRIRTSRLSPRAT